MKKEKNMNLTSNHAFLYGIEVNIKLDYDGKVTITLDNIDSFYSIRKIMFYLENILKSIDVELELDKDSQKLIRESDLFNNQDLELKDKKDKKSEQKDSNKNNKKVSKSKRDLDLDLDLDMDLDLDLDLDKNDKNLY